MSALFVFVFANICVHCILTMTTDTMPTTIQLTLCPLQYNWHYAHYNTTDTMPTIIIVLCVILHSFPELEVKETTNTASSASFLDLYLEFDDSGQLSTKIYDKRDDFNFKIINFPKNSANLELLIDKTSSIYLYVKLKALASWIFLSFTSFWRNSDSYESS
jgi:hypothetical protein